MKDFFSTKIVDAMSVPMSERGRHRSRRSERQARGSDRVFLRGSATGGASPPGVWAPLQRRDRPQGR